MPESGQKDHRPAALIRDMLSQQVEGIYGQVKYSLRMQPPGHNEELPRDMQNEARFPGMTDRGRAQRSKVKPVEYEDGRLLRIEHRDGLQDTRHAKLPRDLELVSNQLAAVPGLVSVEPDQNRLNAGGCRSCRDAQGFGPCLRDDVKVRYLRRTLHAGSPRLAG